MGSQRVGHNLATEQNYLWSIFCFFSPVSSLAFSPVDLISHSLPSTVSHAYSYRSLGLTASVSCPHLSCLYPSSSLASSYLTCILFFDFFLLRYMLIYNTVIILGGQQSNSEMYMYFFLISILFHYRLLQDIEHSSLWLFICFYIWSCVSVNPIILIYHFPFLLFGNCKFVFCIYECLHFVNKFICTNVLDSTYKCDHTIEYFSLSDLLHLVW